MVVIQRTGSLVAIGNSKLAKVCAMKGSGHSYATIANKLGISRQRTCQIIHGLKKTRKTRRTQNSLLTTSEAASLLNIHVNTLRHWSNLGILPTYRIGARGDRRFKQEDIDNLVRKEA
jgi:excisionase family DNA binding protein